MSDHHNHPRKQGFNLLSIGIGLLSALMFSVLDIISIVDLEMEKKHSGTKIADAVIKAMVGFVVGLMADLMLKLYRGLSSFDQAAMQSNALIETVSPLFGPFSRIQTL